MDPKDREDASRKIGDLLFRHEIYQTAGTVFCFRAMPQEVNTVPWIARMLQEGKRVCLPVIVGKGHMKAVALRHANDLIEGPYGIERPAEDIGIPPTQVDLAIVPGLLFDRSGTRLGRGGGYYDRFLSQTGAFRLAVCFARQLVPRLSAHPHDQRMDAILSENGLLTLPPRGAV